MLNLIQSNPDPRGMFGWLTFERKNWLATVAFALAAGFGLGNGHTTQGAISHVSDQLGQTTANLQKVEKVIPAIEAQAGCENNRANKTINLALQPIVVDKSQIPVDNCPHPKIPAISSHAPK